METKMSFKSKCEYRVSLNIVQRILVELRMPGKYTEYSGGEFQSSGIHLKVGSKQTKNHVKLIPFNFHVQI